MRQPLWQAQASLIDSNLCIMLSRCPILAGRQRESMRKARVGRLCSLGEGHFCTIGESICLAKVMPVSCFLWCMCAYIHNAILRCGEEKEDRNPRSWWKKPAIPTLGTARNRVLGTLWFNIRWLEKKEDVNKDGCRLCIRMTSKVFKDKLIN